MLFKVSSWICLAKFVRVKVTWARPWRFSDWLERNMLWKRRTGDYISWPLMWERQLKPFLPPVSPDRHECSIRISSRSFLRFIIYFRRSSNFWLVSAIKSIELWTCLWSRTDLEKKQRANCSVEHHYLHNKQLRLSSWSHRSSVNEWKHQRTKERRDFLTFKRL